MAKAKLFVITGPSGAGKTTIAQEILKKDKNITKVITCTTRAMRKGEKDGVDYKFVTREEFEKFIKKDMLLEKAIVYDNYYGSLRDDVEKIMESGKSVLFVVDVQGAMTIKAKFRGAVSIFVKTPTLDELRKRIEKRKKDSKDVIAQRMQTAREELELENEFNFIVINDDLKKAILEVKKIIQNALS
ncbi:MAG: guanylate kinase [Candidatus Iainarchaeum sp.]